MKETEGVLKGPKKVVTPVCIASYARLLEPAKSLNDEMKYSVSLVFPKDADLSTLKTAAANALIGRWGPDKSQWPKNLRTPFRDGNEKDDKLYKGKTFMNVSSTDAPQVGRKIGNKFVPLMTTEEVYSGMEIRASLSAFAYDKKGNKGVSFGLGNILKVRDGERLDGRTDGDTDFQDFDGDPEGDFTESAGSDPAAADAAADLFG
jgi:hypothetical protein